MYLSSRGVLHLATVGIALAVGALHNSASAQQLDSTSALRPPKDVEEADNAKIRELMRTGVAEYRKKDLEGARQAFAKAWDTARRPEVAAALADVEMKLGRYRDAAEHWDYYLQSHPSDQADAAARLDECRAHVAAVRVDLEPAGAELEVDGTRVPTGGTGGTVWVDPGVHSFGAHSDGHVTMTKSLEVTAGQDVSVRLLLPRVEEARPAPVAAPPPARPSQRAAAQVTPKEAPRPSHTRNFVAIGGTVLAIGAAAVGTWSLIRRSDAIQDRKSLLSELEQEFPERAGTNSVCAPRADLPAKCADVFAKSNDVDRDGNWAVGGFVSAGVLGAATVLTYVIWPSNEKPASSSAIVVAPLAERGADGIQLRFSF